MQGLTGTARTPSGRCSWYEAPQVCGIGVRAANRVPFPYQEHHLNSCRSGQDLHEAG